MAKTKSVLVCDDDELLVDLLEYRLRARGFDVTIARDGGAALNAVGDRLPDVIVLDTMMPVLDGYGVLRRLRSKAETEKVPVLMLTARKGEKDIVGALELGANDYLVKPFLPEELMTRLQRLIA
ncbi:response regulator transcription factor [Sphingomonas jeddahensis]|uniref:Alkaline phosphatase synthesis transcriptional regulatory protein PhoP n=1 Tax=Sphingomonas jeddahensis TaxID=1915074 RepID=A0A1V2EXC7_9SPHN|nr:response regulator [Sphingomonas jeddahensis]ONF97322.1 Alkaline phosphatase synthesis transcriptional regulatory protein PhoP [Sphingomonas jeddahensis]